MTKEEIPIDQSTDTELKDEESNLIEKLIRNQMNKSTALQLAKSAGLTSFTNTNSIFSNVNSAKDVWWLEPNNKKFETDLYIILNNDKKKAVYFFKVPAGTIITPKNKFNQRNDNVRTNYSKIYIPVSDIKFTEEKGFDFTKFFLNKIEY